MYGGQQSKGKGKAFGGNYGRGGYGYETSQFYTPPQATKDRLPDAAARLSQVKSDLSEDAAKAYQALQIALQRHSDPHSYRVNFEKMFYDCLSAVFPEAWDVQARQIGGQNQWEVTVDGSPPMYCSVRLEVLSDNAEFLKEVKSKARVVKDTLLEDDCRWKHTLQPEYGLLSLEKLAQFEQECQQRCNRDGYGSNNRSGGRNQYQWVERGALCQICLRSKNDDILNGQHMCVVCATFQCPDCRYSWTSHHGRLRPDGSTLMGQQCMKCRGQGASVEWRVVSRNGRDYDQQDNNRGGGDERNSKGMHQNELCDACREFGNCTGVFYDPFILTTALQIVTGESEVSWKSFSADMPELLVADLGPAYSETQVVLQPHVYVPSEDRWGGPGGRSYGGKNRQGAGGGAYDSGRGGYESGRGRYDSSGYTDYDTSPPRRGKGPSGKGQNYSQGEHYTSYVAPPLRSSERPTGGVKDEVAFQRYLNRPAGGGGGAANLAPPAPRMVSKGKGKGDDMSGNGQEAYAGSSHSYGGGSAATAVDAVGPMSGFPAGGFAGGTKANKFNKIGSGESSAGGHMPPSQKQSSTPRLDALPPLRRAQFLQVVVRQVKTSGKPESDKFELAEEYLALCNGDYDRAYQYVKSLGEGRQLQ